MIWKTVPGFVEYEVSEYGHLRKNDRELKPERVVGNGRKRFTLSQDGKSYRIKAHTLVALAFIGPKPFKKAEVCHGDSNEQNNHYSNLRWDTRQGNVADIAVYKAKIAEMHHLRRGTRSSKRELLNAAASEFLANAKRPQSMRREVITN